MKTYFEAYQERLESNQKALINLIKEVQEKDNSIEAYINKNLNRFIPGVVFIKGESINSIHFHEVPYRWSGCGFGEHNNSHNGGENTSMPFTANDVITTLKPITSVMWTYKERFKSKDQYLKWSTYLQKVTPELLNSLLNSQSD